MLAEWENNNYIQKDGEIIIYDIDEKRRDVAEENGIHSYPSLEALLADEAICGITIATPNECHKPIAIQALRAGKHVISEKPVMLSLEELDTVIGAVDQRTVLIVKMNEYPFNVLEKYSDSMTSGGEESVIYDLSYILSQLPEKDKKALVSAVGELITEAAKVEIPEIAAGES